MIQTDERHPADDVLLAAMHGEPSATSALGAHVSHCARCAGRSHQMADDERAVEELLGLLDHPLPAAAAVPSLPSRRGRLRRVMLVAGPGALLAIAAAAAVIPGSPLRQWLRGNHATTRAPSAARPPVAPPLTAELPSASGIAIAVSPKLMVEFRRAQGSGVVELLRTTGSDVAFGSRGGKTAYQVAAGRVVIDNQLPAKRYLIELPAGVHEVRVLVGGRVLLRWPEDSARITVSQHPQRARVALGIGVTP